MNPVRRATPDSEAVGSSEDERPWPSAPSFGTLPRKENGVPGLGGGIWSQKRGSFKMEKAAQRNAAREARLGAPGSTHSGLRAGSTPSPSASEGSGALPFAIPLQPTPKPGRSLSHSQGQREVLLVPGARPSSSEHTSVLPLGLLTEEDVDTETESELGGALTHTTSHPPIGTLQRTSTLPATYSTYYGGGHVKEPRESLGGAEGGTKGDRKFEGAFANLSLDHPHRRSQWQSHLGWDDVPNVNESRRHSLADIPTRRGSTAALEARNNMGGGSFWPDDFMYDWQGGPHTETEAVFRENAQLAQFGEVISPQQSSNTNDKYKRRPDPAAEMKYMEKDEQGRPFQIPDMYKVPYIKIDERERAESLKRGNLPPIGVWDGKSSKGKKLFIVSFKSARAECFYLLEGTGLTVEEGDIVIVEADRGQDLGTVQHANVTPEEARLYLRKYREEQYKWLMMFSANNAPGQVNPNAQVYGENGSRNLLVNAPATMQGVPRDNFNNLKPKAIKRLASPHEINMLAEKEGNEAKAKRTCQQKVAHLGLDMEILDAEWQWDFQKLIFYYYADRYINFKDLITELYRIYKTRIWLSAINPASFSQHALGSPPSGIGAGAITGFDSSVKNTYTMNYGQDPDPYGAIPPYRIGYNTYTPNYPSIPGVANSFAPNIPMGSAYQGYGNNGVNEATPSLPPGVTPTGTPADYNYYYERKGMEDMNAGKAYAPANMFAGPSMQQPPPPPPPPLQHQQQQQAPLFNFRAIMPNDRPFEGLPYNVGVAAGLGRQAVLPTPIGTRPPTNGTTTTAQAPAAQAPAAQAPTAARVIIREIEEERGLRPYRESNPDLYDPESYRVVHEYATPYSTPQAVIYRGTERIRALGNMDFPSGGNYSPLSRSSLGDFNHAENARADQMSRER